MWVDFEYKNNKYRVRLEHKQEKKFLKKAMDVYYIHIERDTGFIGKIKTYEDYYKCKFDKNDLIFKRYTMDSFKKSIYFYHDLNYILSLSDEDFKKILIDTTKDIIDNISVKIEINKNKNSRIVDI